MKRWVLRSKRDVLQLCLFMCIFVLFLLLNRVERSFITKGVTTTALYKRFEGVTGSKKRQ